jgi:hypothetical protein
VCGSAPMHARPRPVASENYSTHAEHSVAIVNSMRMRMRMKIGLEFTQESNSAQAVILTKPYQELHIAVFMLCACLCALYRTI